MPQDSVEDQITIAQQSAGVLFHTASLQLTSGANKVRTVGHYQSAMGFVLGWGAKRTAGTAWSSRGLITIRLWPFEKTNATAALRHHDIMAFDRSLSDTATYIDTQAASATVQVGGLTVDGDYLWSSPANTVAGKYPWEGMFYFTKVTLDAKFTLEVEVTSGASTTDFDMAFYWMPLLGSQKMVGLEQTWAADGQTGGTRTWQ